MPSPNTPTDPLTLSGITINAVLSVVVGSLFVIGPSLVGNALDVEIDGWIRLFGVILIGHTLLLAWVRQTQNPVPWVWLNLAMIAPYPLLMMALAATVIEPVGGKALVLVDGVLVGAVALVQYFGLRCSGHASPLARAAA